MRRRGRSRKGLSGTVPAETRDSGRMKVGELWYRLVGRFGMVKSKQYGGRSVCLRVLECGEHEPHKLSGYITSLAPISLC